MASPVSSASPVSNTLYSSPLPKKDNDQAYNKIKLTDYGEKALHEFHEWVTYCDKSITIKRTKEEGYRSLDVLRKVMYLEEQGRLNEALDAADSMSSNWPEFKATVLSRLAMELSRAGADDDLVMGVFMEAIQIAHIADQEDRLYHNIEVPVMGDIHKSKLNKDVKSMLYTELETFNRPLASVAALIDKGMLKEALAKARQCIDPEYTSLMIPSIIPVAVAMSKAGYGREKVVPIFVECADTANKADRRYYMHLRSYILNEVDSSSLDEKDKAYIASLLPGILSTSK